MLNTDDELIALRTDPRWKAALAAMDRNAHPCRFSQESRQLDSWLGEWDVEILAVK